MGVVVDVPSNTALADLDDALRRLLRRELDRQGFEAVEIAFEAPTGEWASKLIAPTVDLFLYDLRESPGDVERTPRDMRVQGATVTAPPPLRLEVTYSVTAWSQAVEDEHRLLSQTLAILFSHSALPADLLQGRLAAAGRRRAIETEVGRPKSDKAEFWTSIGGRFKASLDYAVRLEVESGAVFTRGPEVRTQTVRLGLADVRRGSAEELQRFGGVVRDPDGDPVADAWVVLSDTGRWTSSGPDGRFLFDRVGAGSHQVRARTSTGDEASAVATVPGTGVTLQLPAARRRRAASNAAATDDR